MTETASRDAGQSGTKHRNRDAAAGPLPRMTRDQSGPGRADLDAPIPARLADGNEYYPENCCGAEAAFTTKEVDGE